MSKFKVETLPDEEKSRSNSNEITSPTNLFNEFTGFTFSNLLLATTHSRGDTGNFTRKKLKEIQEDRKDDLDKPRPTLFHRPTMGHYKAKPTPRQTIQELMFGEENEPLNPESNENNENIEMEELGDADLESQEPVSGAVKFGWVEGVFVRCLLNIWGVMLFLRLSWIVGQAGVLYTIVIILLASAVTLITTSSMSAICTNGKVEGGGAYYMISRSLGPGFGGAIGLIFSLANCVAVAMYIAGFVETVVGMYGASFLGFADKSWDVKLISVITIVILMGITQAGSAWESKVQQVLLVVLLVSIVNWFVGSATYMKVETTGFVNSPVIDQGQGFYTYDWNVLMSNMMPQYTEGIGFFDVFAIFFPAATGILAGANISGDLKDASSAIPLGTFSAIIVTSIVYIIVAITIGAVGVRYAGENFYGNSTMEEFYSGYQVACPEGSPYSENGVAACMKPVTYPLECMTYYNDDPKVRSDCLGLLNDNMFMKNFSFIPIVITIGIFAATLSSALASLVSAPKVFQALCKDEIFGGLNYFAVTSGKEEQPVRAFVLAFFIALFFCVFGDLNTIAPIISNFFLASYFLINIAVFMYGTWTPPSWRPSFKYYNKWVSLVGAIVCGAIMMVTSWIAGLITLSIVGAVYAYIKHLDNQGKLVSKSDGVYKNINWGSAWKGRVITQTAENLVKLEKLEGHVKNYRPNIMILTGEDWMWSNEDSWNKSLYQYASHITKKTSVLFVADLIQIKNQPTKDDFLKTNGLVDKIAKRSKLLSNNFQKDKIDAFVKVVSCVAPKTENIDENQMSNVMQTVSTLIQTIGASKIQPNILMMNYLKKSPSPSKHEIISYVDVVKSAFRLGQGVIIQKKHRDRLPYPYEKKPVVPVTIEPSKEIHIWWWIDDGGLITLLAHLLTKRGELTGAKLKFFTVCNPNEDREEQKARFKDMLREFRFETDSVDVVDDPGSVINREDFMTEERKKKLASVEKKSAAVDRDSKVNDLERQMTTKYYLYLNSKIVEEQNKSPPGLTIVSLAVPTISESPMLYHSRMDIMTSGVQSDCLLVRGNQEAAITFLS